MSWCGVVVWSQEMRDITGLAGRLNNEAKPSGRTNILTISGSGPVSLAESMQMVDEILANGNLDR